MRVLWSRREEKKGNYHLPRPFILRSVPFVAQLPPPPSLDLSVREVIRRF